MRSLVGASLVALAFVLAGCGGGKVITPFWAQLTPAERAEADAIETATRRLCAQVQACTPPVIGVGALGSKGKGVHYAGNNSIELPRAVLDGQHRALVAHELAHWWKGHGPAACGGALAVLCEREANYVAVYVLQEGFRMTFQEAARTMHVFLLRLARASPPPTPGHPDWCAELHDFERRVGISQSPCRGN
jgi:hypothetical protein